ncbi:DNA methyltransferase family protein [Pseudomonas haemolytica]|jgi:type I restriction-modification system DNA methylase subunit|uniref:N-6 DNA methylase n=1 Tax=Pseudomonas haemolytica TaxID=2600065 RepID=A0ABS1H0K8_9PSED|nr:hypothetical protein [Pseudomonas haemolytica]MBK3462660.1 hypothetical protein [Pseudomonas haemolytica]
MKKDKSKELLVKFKNDLFKVGYKSCRTEQKNNETSYTTFIEYSFKKAIEYLNLYSVIGGDVFVQDAEVETHKGIQSNAELDDLFSTYCQLVGCHRPFTDLFSMLHEELLLSGKRGEGLGRFYSPPSFADGIVELMPIKNSYKTVGDICSGTGSLKLAGLKRLATENPDALGCLSIVLTDIDELACKVAFIQIAVNMIVNRTQIGSVKMFRCNLITEWRTAGTLMVRYKAPDSVIRRALKARRVKTFNEVIARVKGGYQAPTNALATC